MITDDNYLNWQKRLAIKSFFSRFWVFWAIYSVLIIVVPGLYFLLTGRSKVVALAFFAFILGRVILSPLVYIFYKKPRPYQNLKFAPIHSWIVSFVTKKPTSFPSDHSISLAAIVTVFAYFSPWLGLGLVVLTLLNGIGRVILGYHYMVDIIAGWIFGIFSALVVIYWLSPWLFTR